jgi:hypothetical protein
MQAVSDIEYRNLTKRCSQPLAEKEITKMKFESRNCLGKLAAASCG